MINKIRILKIPGMLNKTCICLVMMTILWPAAITYGHEIDDRIPEKPERNGPSLDAARAYIISEDFNKAVSTYAVLLQKDSASTSLNAEYAYALALNGIYDAALARLDRVWTPNSGSTDVNFFTSQVFALMGYDMLAVEFGNKIAAGSTPAWISSAAPGFLKNYSDRMPGDNMSADGDVVADFKSANRLTAQNYNLMSIAIFEGIITAYPGEYLPYVGSSIALEKAGLNEKSAQTIEQALAILGDNTEQQEARQMLETTACRHQRQNNCGRKKQQHQSCCGGKTRCKREAYAGLCRRYVLTVISEPDRKNRNVHIGRRKSLCRPWSLFKRRKCIT